MKFFDCCKRILNGGEGYGRYWGWERGIERSWQSDRGFEVLGNGKEK
jgi:hypothetical protein